MRPAGPNGADPSPLPLPEKAPDLTGEVIHLRVQELEIV